MVFSGITATEAQIDQKSGAYVNAAFDGDMKKESLLQAESYLNAKTKFNFSDAYTTLGVDVKSIITRITSSLVAMDAINYDMSGYTSRAEAQSMLDVLFDIANKGIKELEDKEVSKFMSGVT